MLETQLHLVNGVVALLAAAIPIYLTVKLNNNLRQLTAILSIFILVHAVHSWLGFFGFDFLSDGVFEPISAAVLMLFGIFYYWIAKQKKVSIKRMVIVWSPVPVLFIFLLINSFRYNRSTNSLTVKGNGFIRSLKSIM